MKYNVTLVDPASYKFAHVLTDICRTIAFGLRELGHACDLTVNSIDNAYMNILVGSHLLTADDVKAVLDSGARFIVLQSEALYLDQQTGSVCNSFQGRQFEAVARPLMQRARAVWDGLTDLPILAKLGVPERKVKRFGIGYAQGLEDVQHRPYDQKDLDVLFFGGLTPYRRQILASLQGMRVAHFEYGPSAFRNDMIARTRINLSVHSSPGLTHVPQGRVGYLLNNRAFVLSEPATDHPPMRDLLTEVPTECMAARCAELLAEPAEIEARAEAAYEGYRRLRMADILDEIL
jgi:hypothetical protein